MIILRLILGFGVGFCFGCAYYIGAKVRQEGKWNDEQAQECFAWIFLGCSGAVVFVTSLWL